MSDHSGPVDVQTLERASDVVVTGRDAGMPVVWRLWECARPVAGHPCPVVVLLHGSFGSWMHWVRNVSALTERCMVVAVDLPGFGQSGAAPTPCMPPDMGQALGKAWLQLQDAVPELAIPNAPLFIAGFSLGAIYAGWMLRELMRPDSGCRRRPAGLMLFGPGGLGPRADLGFSLKPVSRRGQPLAERLAAHRHNLEVIMFARKQNVDDMAVVVQDENVAAARFRGPFVGHPSSLLDALEGVSCPVLGVWGERDAFDADVRIRLRALAAVAPQLDAVVVPEAGHWVMYESSAAVNACLSGWISKIIP